MARGLLQGALESYEDPCQGQEYGRAPALPARRWVRPRPLAPPPPRQEDTRSTHAKPLAAHPGGHLRHIYQHRGIGAASLLPQLTGLRSVRRADVTWGRRRCRRVDTTATRARAGGQAGGQAGGAGGTCRHFRAIVLHRTCPELDRLAMGEGQGARSCNLRLHPRRNPAAWYNKAAAAGTLRCETLKTPSTCGKTL